MTRNKNLKNHKSSKKHVFLISSIVTLIVLILLGVCLVHHLNYQAWLNSPTHKAQIARRIKIRHERRFIRYIAKPAVAQYHANHQVLPSIVISQAAIESNYGDSALYKQGKNPFGIKWAHNGKYVNFKTVEFINGKRKVISSKFKKYPSIKQSVVAHNKLLHYNFFKNDYTRSYQKQAYLLQKGGYATQPGYDKSIDATIQKFHLNKYDK